MLMGETPVGHRAIIAALPSRLLLLIDPIIRGENANSSVG